MKAEFTTNRLLLSPLDNGDSEFILALVNTPCWLRFIGQRNVYSVEEAKEYIQRIVQNPAVTYWVVRLKSENVPVGIITYIKRDYLEFPDIGFAFLPGYAKNGYAFEASSVVLNDLKDKTIPIHLLATTVPDNVDSIRLLKKLGFLFEREIEITTQRLEIYGLALT